MRRWSLQAGFFVDAVAARLGMGQGDFSCLSLLHLEGPATPGNLAERTGLTSGAITGVVDRLERAGWVRREADPDDRRRVIVRAVLERGPEVAAVMAPMLAAAAALQARYDADQLRAVAAFARDATAMLAEETARLRGIRSPVGPAGAGEAAGWPGGGCPVGDALAGVVRLGGSAGALTVTTGALGEALLDCRAPGLTPRVQRAGTTAVVSLRHAGGTRRRDERTLTLNRSLPWSVEVTGGAYRLALLLAEADVRGIAVRGGVSDLDVRLPMPRGAVPVRITGGASNVRLERPGGVPVVVRAGGGIGRLTVDGREHPGVRGEAVAYGGGPRDPDRYEVEVRGGASRIAITAGRAAPG